MSEELKPCPCCGSSVKGETTVCNYTIRCRSCGATMMGDSQTPRKVIKAWNTRNTSLDSELAQVKEELKVARELLLKSEWAAMTCDIDELAPTCWCCDNFKRTGHEKDCLLAAAIKN